MNATQFEKIARDLYASQHHYNILRLAQTFFDQKKDVVDVCSGPGLVAEKLDNAGFKVWAYDAHPGFIKRIIATGRTAQAECRDVNDTSFLLVPGSQVVFTNASGYFTLAQVESLLKRCYAGVVIANFIIKGDKQPKTSQLIGRRGEHLLYNIGDDHPLVLRTFAETELLMAFYRASLKVALDFKYTDFKTERMYVLVRR